MNNNPLISYCIWLINSMTSGIRVKKTFSELTRSFLLSKDVLNTTLLPCIEDSSIILPLKLEAFEELVDREENPEINEFNPLKIEIHNGLKDLDPEYEYLSQIDFKSKSLGKKIKLNQLNIPENKSENSSYNLNQQSLSNNHKLDTLKVTIPLIKAIGKKILGNNPLSIEIWNNGICVILSGIQELDSNIQSSFANKLIDEFPGQLNVIAMPLGGHEGPFRIQQFKILYPQNGDPQSLLITNIKENGILLYLNLATVWYSKRFEQERERIASLIIKQHTLNTSKSQFKEMILCLFAGIGPFPLVLLKRAGKFIEKIYATELNHNSYSFALKNASSNGYNNNKLEISNDEAIQYCNKLKELGLSFDRIIMPAPRCSNISILDSFINSALQVAKEGTFIHFYDHIPSSDIEERSEHFCKISNRRLKLIENIICGQQSPHNFRVCYEFSVISNINI